MLVLYMYDFWSLGIYLLSSAPKRTRVRKGNGLHPQDRIETKKRESCVPQQRLWVLMLLYCF